MVSSFSMNRRFRGIVNFTVQEKDELCLKQSCCEKRQKGPNQETGFKNKGCLKVPINPKLVARSLLCTHQLIDCLT